MRALTRRVKAAGSLRARRPPVHTRAGGEWPLAAGRREPLVDAGMRELYFTGWMHNRVRMLVASLLTKRLCLR